ncbi:MAG: FAD/NAD(P)-binding protein [Hyphomicrobiaceae bacterium]|nr:FAD/NAD(P)-binding protein [Hyphomicrobiaceae bacterium]
MASESQLESHADNPMVPVLARVISRREETTDIVTLDVVADNWTGFSPGQFNMLSVFGVGEIPISMSGDPRDCSKITHTIRAVGAVSRALCNLQPGSIVGLRGPFGAPWPVSKAEQRDIIVAAGGLGLAPVRPILCQLMADRDRFGKITLIYGTRHPSDILFREELSAWRTRLDMGVEVTVDHADRSWHGHVGVVPHLLRNADFDPATTTAFVCGPEIMMRFTANALTKAGVSSQAIYLSMERNMQCAIGLCGHCQYGPVFICKDGPVFDWGFLKPLMAIKEL